MEPHDKQKQVSSQTIVNPLHFFMLPDRKDAVVFEGGLAMYSNMELPDEPAPVPTEPQTEKNYIPYPVRLMMVMVIVCRRGGIRVRCNLEEHTIEPGEMLLVLPGSTIETLSIRQPSHGCFIAIGKEMSSEMHPLHGAMLESFDLVRPTHLLASETQMEFLEQLFRMLRCCTAMPAGEERSSAVGACARMLSCLLQQCKADSKREIPERSPRCNIIFMQFVRDVLKHFREHRNMQFYADRQFITPKYLGAAVLQASGRRAYDIICDQVILEAKVLLSQPDITVQRVSLELNFPNHSFFSKFFKAHTGMTPQAFIAGRV